MWRRELRKLREKRGRKRGGCEIDKFATAAILMESKEGSEIDAVKWPLIHMNVQ